MSNIYDLTISKLETAIKYKNVISYLEGVGMYQINTDPRNIDSPHAYNFSLEAYNKYAKEHPELKLKELFEEAILERLNSEQCHFIDVYSIYCCLIAQIKLEKNKRASFEVDKAKLNEIFKLLKEKTLLNKDRLKRSKWDRGIDFNEGMYEYMQVEDDRISQVIGRKIL